MVVTEKVIKQEEPQVETVDQDFNYEDDVDEDENNELQSFMDFVMKQQAMGRWGDGPREVINMNDIIVEQDDDDEDDDDDNFDDDDVEDDEDAIEGQQVENEDDDDVDDKLQTFANFVHDKEGPDSPPVNLEDIIVEEDDDDDDDDNLGDDDDVKQEEEIAIKGQEVVDDDAVAVEEETTAIEGQEVVDDAFAVTDDNDNDLDESSLPLVNIIDATSGGTNSKVSVPDAPDVQMEVNTKSSENSHNTEFYGYKDYTCRSMDGSPGVPGEEYTQYKSVTREWCETECATEVDCKAYDYNEQNMQCQLWYFFYNTYQPQDGSLCYYKKF